MRTTAVYGLGNFGAADREQTRHRPECAAPFQVEMLSVYLTRCFVMDLVEHMARARNPGTAVPLDPAVRRRFGIGNSTGLGMAPFLVNHPQHRHIARRAQIAARLPYAEIRDNTLSADMLPVDILRLKLSFFGACHFDPRSDRWLRINMFQHAPFPTNWRKWATTGPCHRCQGAHNDVVAE